MNYSAAIVADILGVSKETLKKWRNNKKLIPHRDEKTGEEYYVKEQLGQFEQAEFLFHTDWDSEEKYKPIGDYKLIELFAGAGGLALGLEQAGLRSVLLNEIDKDACSTLRMNRPDWNVVESDISQIDFTEWVDGVDIVTGGFPCQAFSYAGNKMGFDDTRGTLFYEFARAVKEAKPKVLLAENVKGLVSHEKGKTLSTILNVINEIGYETVPVEVLRAIFYRVPQKRERLFLVAIRKDLSKYVEFKYPAKFPEIFTLRDALKRGVLYDRNVPVSDGQVYPARKKRYCRKFPKEDIGEICLTRCNENL